MTLTSAQLQAVSAETIEALEARRYAAMLAADVASLDEMLDEELVYTHSQGERDDKASYLDKVARGVFVYHEISHSSDRIVVRQHCAVVAGTMRATASVGGEQRRIDNSCMAVWVRSGDRWRLVAYQPTPFRRAESHRT